MNEKEILISSGGGEMTVFVAHPHGRGPFPLAVVFMDAMGYRDQIKENTRRLAAGGYYAVAPDLFHRVAPRFHFTAEAMAADGFRDRLMGLIASVKLADVIEDAEAIVNASAFDPEAAPQPMVLIGYCMGARLALHVAASFGERVAAVACIHPSALVTEQDDSPHHDLSTVRAEVYVSFAENDGSATAENVDRFRAEVERQSVRGVVERVPGTAHGFALADLPVYNEPAAERHFEETLLLWQRNVAA